MSGLSGRAFRKIEQNLSEQLLPGERLEASEPSVDGRWLWFLTSRRIIVVDRTQPQTKAFDLDAIRYYRGRHSRLEIWMQDGLGAWLHPSGRSNELRTGLAGRLMSMPRMIAHYPGAFGDGIFSYHPWSPGIPASWRVEEVGALLPAEKYEMDAAASRDLLQLAESGAVPQYVTVLAQPFDSRVRLVQAFLHSIAFDDQPENLDSPYVIAHMVGRDGTGPRELIIAGDSALYFVDKNPTVDLTYGEFDVPEPAIKPAPYADMRDWQDWEPEPDGDRFLFRLSIKPEGVNDWQLILLGLPTSEAGLAVRDQIVTGILKHSGSVQTSQSPLGRDVSKTPHPVAWKQD